MAVTQTTNYSFDKPNAGEEVDTWATYVNGNMDALDALFFGDTASRVAVDAYVPSTASSAGKAGQITYDGSYVYICVATNTWRRVAVSTW